MTDQPLPQFPATPEEIKAASEKAMNFWVGALSPMWVPFWAASSFGLGAWAISQNMSKKMGEGLTNPEALTPKWPGFTGVWSAFGAPVDSVEKHAPVPVPEMFTGVRAAMAAVMTPTEVEVPVKAADPASQPKIITPKVVKAKTAKPKVVKPAIVKVAPVKATIAKPVVTKAVPVKPAPVKAASVAVTPKPIAKSLSAVKTPKPKA